MLCHGEKGMGDGPGAKTIKVKPANFTDAKMMGAETDGSLFWKMTNGRGPMPSWKDDLTGKGTLATCRLHSQARQGRREVSLQEKRGAALRLR